MKILIAADGSIYTKRMLAYVAAHDEWLGSRHAYTVLYCAPEPAGVALSQRFHEATAEGVFEPIRDFFAQQSIEAEFIHAVGHAPELIADRARSGRFDLLVMGSHGHGQAAGIALGSVASDVLGGCSTPMLLIR
jgi:nucleotide-binding universal stress UspA family protein